MGYQECIEAMQATDPWAGAAAFDAMRLADANINPSTGLASDYLNHFHEAIMLLEMLPSCPDCRADFLGWRPRSYREHFVASRLKTRDLAIAAYDTADPAVRGRLDVLAGTMTAVLEATRAALCTDLPRTATDDLADRATARLKPLVARAGAVINGEADSGLLQTPQAMVDGLMKSPS